MARVERERPFPDESLADRVSIGLLTSIFPMSLIDEVVEAGGCADRRRRALPARLTIYYVLALCLFIGRNYDQVMRLLLNGLAWRSRGARRWEVPTASAISRARARLGAEPMRILFCRVSGPVAAPRARDSWYAGLRLVTLDGSTLDVSGTSDNAAFAGAAGRSRIPQVRVLAVAECGTHALIDATFGDPTVGERVLARRMLRCLAPGMLLLAGSAYWDPELWRTAAGTGAQLLWEVSSRQALPVGRDLADGSYLSWPDGLAGVPVRVVELPAGGPRPGTEPAPVRLVTTLTDPGQAPAAELALRYARRWVMDSALAWVKSDQDGSRITLRSKNPELVAQEIWALLCTYQAVRMLTCQATGITRPPCPCAWRADYRAPAENAGQ
ncbi:IS4 family transposase [Actinomadura scrupuli]|uniref:IS4 family transposase n=1 Tax=Actinomadura scrupuli TaxID=559629 RepID=UPI003D984944